MTQAFNLAQLANNLNTSGQLDATDGLSGLVANSNLASSGTANSSTFLRGDRTWATVTQKVLQVVQTQKTDFFSTNSTSFVDISGMSVSITPTSASSQILVSFVLNASSNQAGWYGSYIRLVRNSTSIAIGNDTGDGRRQATLDYSFNTSSASLITPMPMEWLDSPASTSAVTYKLQMMSLQNTTVFVNRSSYDNPSDAYDSNVVSTITVMEIGA